MIQYQRLSFNERKEISRYLVLEIILKKLE